MVTLALEDRFIDIALSKNHHYRYKTQHLVSGYYDTISVPIKMRYIFGKSNEEHIMTLEVTAFSSTLRSFPLLGIKGWAIIF